jgi:uncharacterized protein (DUF983 family)
MNAAHVDMDDMAEFGAELNAGRVGKLTEAEIDRAIKQREEPESWHLPHMTRLLGVCSGDCNQGRRCDCAPSPAEACTELGADDSEWESADAAVLLFMIKLLGGILAFCFLAWAVA